MTETIDRSGRPFNERDGTCICDYNPETTDGPQEDCPFHGRPYTYWVKRVDVLSARLAAVEALIGGPTPPVFLSDRPNKIVRVQHRRDDLAATVTESMVKVDDIVAALAEGTNT